MSLRQSVLTCLVALIGLSVNTACDPQTLLIAPDPPPGQVVTEDGVTPVGVLPTVTAFLSSDRPIVIRDDASEGKVLLTATSSGRARFAWTVEVDELELEVCLGKADTTCEPLPADGIDENDGTESLLSIQRILSDPGADGKEITVIVTVTPLDAGGTPAPENAVTRQRIITAVRPDAELGVTIAASRASVTPNGRVELTATVSGGAVFDGEPRSIAPCAPRGRNQGDNQFAPAEEQAPYSMCWTVTEDEELNPSNVPLPDGADPEDHPFTIAGIVTIAALETGDKGESILKLTYTAPTATGTVQFEIEVTDRQGKRDTDTLNIQIKPTLDLTISLESELAGAQPDVPFPVKSRLLGGVPPYTICYATPKGGFDGGDDDSCVEISVAEDTFSTCVCNIGTEANANGDEFLEDTRNFLPPNEQAAVPLAVAVRDAVGKVVTDTLTIEVSTNQIGEGGGVSPSVSLTAAPDLSSICPTKSTDIVAGASGGTGNYTFTFALLGLDPVPGDGETLLDGGNGTATYTAPTNPPGSFVRQINVRVDETGGTFDEQQVTITTSASPIADAGADKVACEDETSLIVGGNPTAAGGNPPYTYSWTRTGGGATYLDDTNAANPTFDIAAAVAAEPALPFTLNLCVDVSDGGACPGIAISCAQVKINAKPAVVATNSGPVCAGGAVTLEGAPGAPTSYAWSGPNAFNSTLQNPVVSPAVAGTYSLTGTDANGCSETDNTTVVVDPLPVATPGGDRSVCVGNAVTLNGSSSFASGCIWSTAGDGSFNDASLLDAEYTPGAADLAADQAELTLTCDGSGACNAVQDAETITLSIVDNPTATITTDTTLCEDQTSNSASVPVAGGPAVYLWAVTGGNIISGQSSASIIYNATANPGANVISVSVTITEGSCVSNGSIDVSVTDPTSCNDGNECTTDTCVAGTCQNDNNTIACTDDGNDCTDDVCSAGACTHPDLAVGTSCGSDNDTDCDNPDTCNGAGSCRPNEIANGTTCTTDGNECTDDVCTSGVCTHNNSAVGSTCGDPTDNDCDNADTCDGAGVCQSNYESGGTSCGDNVNNDCLNADSCDGAGICLTNDESDGTSCTDDGNDCTDDVCASGVCTHPDLNSGTFCGDPTNDSCTDRDTCDGNGTCLDNHEPAGELCGDPTNDDCTNADTCDGAGTCLVNHESNGTVCDDEPNDCTSDLCQSGSCVHTNLVVGTACGDISDTDCDDPDTCNGLGVCLGNNVADNDPCPDDGNDCTTDLCDSGNCVHDDKSNNVVCTPDDFCTTAAQCLNGNCIKNPVARDCGDGLDCTTDSCDDINEVCVNDIDAGNCLITATCFTDGTENPGNDCQECDSGANDADWSNKADATSCDDGLFCIDAEECTAGVCGGGTPHDCDDALACTTDTCDDGGDVCVNDLDSGTCNIGGDCHNDTDVNPANQCQECDSAQDANDWTDDDSNSCDTCPNPPCACSAGVCNDT